MEIKFLNLKYRRVVNPFEYTVDLLPNMMHIVKRYDCMDIHYDGDLSTILREEEVIVDIEKWTRKEFVQGVLKYLAQEDRVYVVEIELIKGDNIEIAFATHKEAAALSKSVIRWLNEGVITGA